MDRPSEGSANRTWVDHGRFMFVTCSRVAAVSPGNRRIISRPPQTAQCPVAVKTVEQTTGDGNIPHGP